MTRTFKNTWVLRQTMERKNLQEYYWPTVYLTPKRDYYLLRRQWFEGWYCDFIGNGLKLEIIYFISESQLPNWPELKNNNPAVIQSELTFHPTYTFETPCAALTIIHDLENAERLRKEIYISEKFKETADHVWAAQFFLNETVDSKLLYALGFKRDLTSHDQTILADLATLLRDLQVIYQLLS